MRWRHHVLLGQGGRHVAHVEVSVGTGHCRLYGLLDRRLKRLLVLLVMSWRRSLVLLDVSRMRLWVTRIAREASGHHSWWSSAYKGSGQYLTRKTGDPTLRHDLRLLAREWLLAWERLVVVVVLRLRHVHVVHPWTWRLHVGSGLAGHLPLLLCHPL